jgi:hypothetical protein
MDKKQPIPDLNIKEDNCTLVGTVKSEFCLWIITNMFAFGSCPLLQIIMSRRYAEALVS